MENPNQDRGDATARPAAINPEPETVTIPISGVTLELAINLAIATIESLMNEVRDDVKLDEGPLKDALEVGFNR